MFGLGAYNYSWITMDKISSARANAAQKKAAEARNLAEIRQDIDALSEILFSALAERKKHGFNADSYSMATDDNPENLSGCYVSILKLLCENSPHAKVTPEIRAIDTKIMALIQKRTALGIKALASKRNAGLALRDIKREKELFAQAEKIAASYGINPKTGAEIMSIIIKKTINLEEQEESRYNR